MDAKAPLSGNDMRRAMRYPVDYPVVGEHRQRGDVPLHIANISSQGFMATGAHGLRRGDRLAIRFPVIGRIEAHVVWSVDERSGFQFERTIRPDDFTGLIDAMRTQSTGAKGPGSRS